VWRHLGSGPVHGKDKREVKARGAQELYIVLVNAALGGVAKDDKEFTLGGLAIQSKHVSPSLLWV
jgi:hypothetical protein